MIEHVYCMRFFASKQQSIKMRSDQCSSFLCHSSVFFLVVRVKSLDRP